MSEQWNVKTYADIKTHISKGKTVSLILDGSAMIGNAFSNNKNVITNVRTCKNVRELEVEINDRGTYIPITEMDIILFGQ